MKTEGGSISIPHSLLTSVLEGGERSASHPAHFTSQERTLVPTKHDTWAQSQSRQFWRRENLLVAAAGI